MTGAREKTGENGNPPKKQRQQKLLNTSRNAEKSSIYETGEKERKNEQEREEGKQGRGNRKEETCA